MNYVPLIEMGEYLNSFEIPNIPAETKFWLIRTKSGYFYDELENYKAALEVIKLSDDTDIDMDKVLKDLELINELSDSLRFESNEEFATSDQINEEE